MKAQVQCMDKKTSVGDDQSLLYSLTMGPFSDPAHPNDFVYTQEVASDVQSGEGVGATIPVVSCNYLVPRVGSFCPVPTDEVHSNTYDVFYAGVAAVSGTASEADGDTADSRTGATAGDDTSDASPAPFVFNSGLLGVFEAPERVTPPGGNLAALIGPNDATRHSTCPSHAEFLVKLCATQIQLLHEETVEREREYAEAFRDRHGRHKETPAVRGEDIDTETRVVMKDMLIVITTCNHLDITLKNIKSLERAFEDYAAVERPDILIVDDRSTDGIPYLLRRMGYAVVQSLTPKGVTFSWNVGYRVAKLLKNYNHIVFMNNDIIVPRGTFELLYYDLKFFPLVVPTTAYKGSGIPQQSFEAVHKISNMFYEEFLMNPFNTPEIQRTMLQERSRELKERSTHIFKTHTTTAIPSFRWYIYPRFNGFLFCINISAVSEKNIPYDEFTFFNPHDLMIHQEEHITDLFYERYITPVIEKYAFAYHYKSVTVAVAGRNQKIDKRENLSFYHTEGRDEPLEPLEPIQLLRTTSGDNPTPRAFARKLSHYYSVDEMFRVPAAVHFKLLTQGEFEVYPSPESRVVVIGIVSDDTPVGQDRHFNLNGIAHALGSGLVASSENVRVEYLQPHRDWYSLEAVDVLLVLTPHYKLRLVRRSKPTLFTVAWIVQDVAEWMSLPFLGNYLKVIASNTVLAGFVEKALRGEGADGLPIQCFAFCHSLLSTMALARVTERSFGGSAPLVQVLSLASSVSAVVPRPNEGSSGVLLYLAKPASYCTDGDGSAHNELLDSIGRANPKPATEQRCSGAPILWGDEFKRFSIIIEDSGTTDAEAALSNGMWSSDSVTGTHVVFNAIMHNVLVVTNNAELNDQLFGGLLPTFSKMGESVAIVSRYLTDTSAREELLRKLQAVVLSSHRFVQRAGTFKDMLRGYPLVLPIIGTPPAAVPDAGVAPVAPPALCVALRTQYRDLDKLHQTLDGLLTQHSSSGHRDKVGLKVFLFDANANKVLPEQSRESRIVLDNLRSIADAHNNRSQSNHVSIVGEHYIYYNHYEASLYYHSRSDMLLRYMLGHPVAMGSSDSNPDAATCGKSWHGIS